MIPSTSHDVDVTNNRHTTLGWSCHDRSLKQRKRPATKLAGEQTEATWSRRLLARGRRAFGVLAPGLTIDWQVEGWVRGRDAPLRERRGGQGCGDRSSPVPPHRSGSGCLQTGEDRHHETGPAGPRPKAGRGFSLGISLQGHITALPPSAQRAPNRPGSYVSTGESAGVGAVAVAWCR